MNENTKNITNNGGYSAEDLVWHQHSNRLLIKIMELWPDKGLPIVDLGCGHNFYMNTMELLGFRTAGLDFVPYPGVLQVDITTPISTELLVSNVEGAPVLPNVLSLEVGEHIPAELADGYLDNVCRFGGDVILSWAIPGQAGIGHINCQGNEWVISRMFDRGYHLDHAKTAEMREAVKDCHCNWFRNTLMYFHPKR